MTAEPTNQSPPTATGSPPGRRWRPSLWPSLAGLLVIVLIICLLLWRPWQPNIKASERTITVTGNTTLKAEPDEFIFYPTYDFNSADKQTALADMTAKSNEVVGQLKKFGVADSKIKTSSNNYSGYYPIDDASGATYTLYISATVDSKALAQKVEDYLLTTGPSGVVTPTGNLSDAKQKQLEATARDKAEQDARAKAEQSAKNLGFKVREVKSIEDNSFNGGLCGYGLCAVAQTDTNGSAAGSGANQPSQLSLQPGENELNYSVKVTYYIK